MAIPAIHHSTMYGVIVSGLGPDGDATVLPSFKITVPNHEVKMHGPDIAGRRAVSVIAPLVQRTDLARVTVFVYPDDGERIEGRCSQVVWDREGRNHTTEYRVS